MTRCTRPPELTLAQLSALVDGDADDATFAHAQSCGHCFARAARLSLAQDRLRALLWRNACPPPEQLRDYAWNLLPHDEMRDVAHHLAFCPYCTHDFFRDYYAADASGDDLFTVAARAAGVRTIGEIEYAGAAPRAAASHAVERAGGSSAATPLIFDTGDNVLISLTPLPDDGQGGRWVLEGAVSGLDPDGLQAHLWLDGTLVASIVLDAGGDFRLPGLAPAVYYLTMQAARNRLWIGPVPIGVP